jgi:hypothetical protein
MPRLPHDLPSGASGTGLTGMSARPDRHFERPRTSGPFQRRPRLKCRAGETANLYAGSVGSDDFRDVAHRGLGRRIIASGKLYVGACGPPVPLSTGGASRFSAPLDRPAAIAVDLRVTGRFPIGPGAAILYGVRLHIAQPRPARLDHPGVDNLPAIPSPAGCIQPLRMGSTTPARASCSRYSQIMNDHRSFS